MRSGSPWRPTTSSRRSAIGWRRLWLELLPLAMERRLDPHQLVFPVNRLVEVHLRLFPSSRVD